MRILKLLILQTLVFLLTYDMATQSIPCALAFGFSVISGFIFINTKDL